MTSTIPIIPNYGIYLVRPELSKRIVVNNFHGVSQLVDRMTHPFWYQALSQCGAACHPLPGECLGIAGKMESVKNWLLAFVRLLVP